ncbi:unnamed protein product [Callosobruchus maculatus]|uniref:J domain-containing protein n=1 Tax=Callosobruchus maculatus TaxID=64391 RepID=A0A653DN12_CALMS|nr:unnamed protein product [Callosobruchus maculatus]
MLSKFHFKYIKLFLSQVRLMSKSAKSKNHYDSLGISKESTQGEIKSAYYKLSMVYHPDKNPNDAASSQKFRDITAAYEVLGNIKTRKLYDRGLYMGSMGHSSVAEEPKDEPIDRFHQSRETRSRPPTPTGKTPIYDFDEWSKQHYGATFRRMQTNKENARIYQMHRQMEQNSAKAESVLFLLALVFFICMCFSTNNGYDQVSSYKNKQVEAVGNSELKK